jgi:succinate dehydrogenase hydrophobic anchor subunit
MSDDEFVELDEYQFEEMNTELSELEGEILSFTRSHTLPIRTFWKRIESRKKETATRMRMRMSRRMAITAGCIILAAYFIGFIPDIVRQFTASGTPASVIGVAGAGTLVMALTCMAFLLHSRRGVRKKIRNYNGTMRKILGAIQNSADHFSEYLSKCCAYMRGRSILQALEKKTVVALTGIRQMTDHIEQLNAYMDMIKSWLNDFELSPLNGDGYAKNISFDFDIPPERNKEYLLKNNETSIEVPSVGGSQCFAPYPFVTTFAVDRISVFEKELTEDTLSDKQEK